MGTWVYGIIGAASVIILACLLFIFFQITGLVHQRVHKPILPFSCTKVEEPSNYKENAKGRVCSFTYKEIEDFSEGFSNLVGKGSTNYVYKGILPDGTEVAVKRLKEMVLNQLDTEKGFQSQYAPNGTLYENLHGEEHLSWRQRMRIALGTAYGLSYLHHSCNPPMFHGNFNSLNILLTEDYAAKIAGFGKMSGRGGELKEKLDYGIDVHIHKVEGSRATDVYAFGVLLLELVSGRQASSQSDLALVELVKQLHQRKDKMADIADPTLRNIVPGEFDSVLQIACLCIQQDTAARPNMEGVIQMLVQTLGIGSETAAPITNSVTLRGLVDNF